MIECFANPTNPTPTQVTMSYNEDPSEGLTLGNLVLGTLTSIIALLTTLCNTISLSHLLVVVHRDRDKRKNSTTILYLNLGKLLFSQNAMQIRRLREVDNAWQFIFHKMFVSTFPRGVCDVLQGIVSSLSAISLLNNRVLPGWLTWFCPVSAACVEILPSMSLFITMWDYYPLFTHFLPTFTQFLPTFTHFSGTC